jgi:hypothetical protein
MPCRCSASLLQAASRPSGESGSYICIKRMSKLWARKIWAQFYHISAKPKTYHKEDIFWFIIQDHFIHVTPDKSIDITIILYGKLGTQCWMSQTSMEFRWYRQVSRLTDSGTGSDTQVLSSIKFWANACVRERKLKMFSGRFMWQIWLPNYSSFLPTTNRVQDQY